MSHWKYEYIEQSVVVPVPTHTGDIHDQPVSPPVGAREGDGLSVGLVTVASTPVKVKGHMFGEHVMRIYTWQIGEYVDEKTLDPGEVLEGWFVEHDAGGWSASRGAPDDLVEVNEHSFSRMVEEANRINEEIRLRSEGVGEGG